MTDLRTPAFEAVRAIARPGFFDEPGALDGFHSFLDAAGAGRELSVDGLTVRMLTEIMHHEAIVLEAYKDSKGIWTWSVGVTSASGHKVERYKDKPQTVAHCLAIYVWLLRHSYLPEVRRAFRGRALTEAQLTAALSFHWNTGAIDTADWVELWLAGDVTAARLRFMDWKRPASIIPRRQAERDLFFGGKWAGTGLTTIWPVRKPSYAPNWSEPQRVDVTADLAKALAA